MAKDFQLLGEMYMGIYEGTATGTQNVQRMKADQLKKQLQAIDANIQSSQQKWQAATPQQRGFMKGFANRLKYDQDQRAQIAAQLTKLDPTWAATQTAGTTAPVTGKGTGGAVPGAATAAASTTTQAPAGKGSLPGAIPAAVGGTVPVQPTGGKGSLPGTIPTEVGGTSQPAPVKASSGTQEQPAPSTARYLPKYNQFAQGRGGKASWQSK